jgi:hypothetical protein
VTFNDEWSSSFGIQSETVEAHTELAARSPEDARVCFDLSVEEVMEEVNATFGQMAASLSSNKWDRRVKALKGVGTALRGNNISRSRSLCSHTYSDCPSVQSESRGVRDVQCFRAACLLLHVTLRDKVLPVIFAAHELFRVTFQHAFAVSDDEAAFAMDEILQVLVAKLGDPNIRLHESAAACVAFAAEQPFFGLSLVLKRLEAHLNQQRVRGAQLGRMQMCILDTVGNLIRQFPGRRLSECGVHPAKEWTVTSVKPFFTCGALAEGVTGFRAQQSALGLAITVCQSLGRSSLKPLLADLPAATRACVRERVDAENLEDDSDEGDVMDMTFDVGLCIQGTKVLKSLGPAMSGNEDCLMDEILEETGFVFYGCDIPCDLAQCSLEEEIRDLVL